MIIILRPIVSRYSTSSQKLQSYFMHHRSTTYKLLALSIVIVAIMIQCAPSNTNQPAAISSSEKLAAPKTAAKKTIDMKGLDINYCMGRFEPKQHADFVAIPVAHADRKGMYMRKDAYDAFVKMSSKALESGITLTIRSAARNFDYQRGIWERKWTGTTKLSDGTNVATDIKKPLDKALKILEYSSMPGTSRHHWGTDIDLNAFNNEYFESGEGKKIYDWLTANASSFGYCQPYTPKGDQRPHGYNEEKWHWSYQPVSQNITDYAERNLRNEMIEGFMGAETAPQIDVVGKYVLGIHQGCRH